MKVVILAAGKGTRMLPLTKTTPKVLIKINGRPFLKYVIENLHKAGYNDLGIVVGHLKEKIAEFLKANSIKAELIEQKQQLGTGDAVLQAKNFVGDEDFLVLGGDNLWSVEDFKKMNQDDKYNYISGVEVEHPESYGVLVAEGELLKEIKEKPKENFGKLINAGLYKFKQEIFEKLKNIKLSPRGELELTDAVSELAKDGKVKVVKAKWWLDLGKKEDISKVEEFLKIMKKHEPRQ